MSVRDVPDDLLSDSCCLLALFAIPRVLFVQLSRVGRRAGPVPARRPVRAQAVVLPAARIPPHPGSPVEAEVVGTATPTLCPRDTSASTPTIQGGNP